MKNVTENASFNSSYHLWALLVVVLLLLLLVLLHFIVIRNAMEWKLYQLNSLKWIRRNEEVKESMRVRVRERGNESTWIQWNENCLMVYTKLRAIFSIPSFSPWLCTCLGKVPKGKISTFFTPHQCYEDDFFYSLFWLIIKRMHNVINCVTIWWTKKISRKKNSLHIRLLLLLFSMFIYYMYKIWLRWWFILWFIYFFVKFQSKHWIDVSEKNIKHIWFKTQTKGEKLLVIIVMFCV